ncbi:hypothetical protein [Pedobacter sp. UBA5917]|jgi:hypothetical protein|uniref:hypothetical protein n=1 Tax=Pedobacter sp. UBA5917 TaxID=1947061 RepID=UPI0025D805C0|nr:hypothetical protein [Pedobacter sp. UBA5917]
MTFLYTARGTYDQYYNQEGMLWNDYIQWARLPHLTELVSLDGMLNEVLVKPDYNDATDWDFIHISDLYQTDLFTTVDYVFKRMIPGGKFNLLAVVVEPDKPCNDIPVDGYEFVGYELLDQDFSISALTNCGGFDESFLPSDLNAKGLIDNFEKAYEIKKLLIENNPEEHHADTNVIAVWRHKIIGR